MKLVKLKFNIRCLGQQIGLPQLLSYPVRAMAIPVGIFPPIVKVLVDGGCELSTDYA